MQTDRSDNQTTGPDAWPDDRLRDEVAFCASVAGRLRREDREVAFALEIKRLQNEVADLRCSVIAFGSPWAVEHAREFGFPPGHLHSTHYDILARAGARMDDFTRHEECAHG